MRRILAVLRALWQELRHPRRGVSRRIHNRWRGYPVGQPSQWSRDYVARRGLPFLLALVLALPGCASMGGPRHVGAVSLAATAGVLETFMSVEPQLVCGQPSAPQAPRCVPVPRHLQIMSHVERAATLGAAASRVMATIPRGSAQPAEVVTMLVQVQGLIAAAMALVPESQDKAALSQAIGVGGAR